MTNQRRYCTIVPPYLLAHVAAATGGELAARARSTLLADARLRTRRAASTPTPSASSARPDRRVSDAQGRTDLPGVPVRSEGAEPVGDAATDEAYGGLGATFALFSEAFGRDSFDGAGADLLASVHYGTAYDNAFWDGGQMVFGDGDGQVFGRFTRPVTIVGHELSHGVVQSTADLAYQGQSGALNESVADVFGVLVEQFALGQEAEEASWLVGEGLFGPTVAGRALRSLAAPGTAYDDPVLGRDPQPGHLRDYVETEDDNGGVHLNSGIPNRAFHLTASAIGGPAWERAGQVWYDTLTAPTLAPDADFAAFAALTVQCAQRRFGDSSVEARAVREGWGGVGLEV